MLVDLPNAVDGVVLALGQPCVRINVRGSGAGSCCPAEEVITNTFRIFWELEREVCLIRLGFAVDGYCPLEVACCTICRGEAAAVITVVEVGNIHIAVTDMLGRDVTAFKFPLCIVHSIGSCFDGYFRVGYLFAALGFREPPFELECDSLYFFCTYSGNFNHCPTGFEVRYFRIRSGQVEVKDDCANVIQFRQRQLRCRTISEHGVVAKVDHRNAGQIAFAHEAHIGYIPIDVGLGDKILDKVVGLVAFKSVIREPYRQRRRPSIASIGIWNWRACVVIDVLVNHAAP